jgi:hypothetical protein
MPIGAGLFPAGSFPGGFGIPEAGPFSQFAPLPDPTTGLSQTGRFINQKTGDYVFTADGRLQGMPTVEQLVLLAITRIDLSRITEKGPGFKKFFASLVQAALADLIGRKLVQIKSIDVLEPNPDAGLAVLNWIDLTTGQPVPTTIGGT